MEDPVLVLTQNVTQTTTCIFLFPFFFWKPSLTGLFSTLLLPLCLAMIYGL